MDCEREVRDKAGGFVHYADFDCIGSGYSILLGLVPVVGPGDFLSGFNGIFKSSPVLFGHVVSVSVDGELDALSFVVEAALGR